MQKIDKQLDLEKRMNLQLLNFQINSKSLDQGEQQERKSIFFKNFEDNSLMNQVQSYDQIQNKPKISLVSIMNQEYHNNVIGSPQKLQYDKNPKHALIQSQKRNQQIKLSQRNQHIDQFGNMQNINLNLQGSQIYPSYQKFQDSSIGSKKNMKYQDNSNSNMLKQQSSQLLKNSINQNDQLLKQKNIQQSSGLQILQPIIEQNNEKRFNYQRLDNQNKKNNQIIIKESIFHKEKQQNQQVVSDFAPQLLQQKPNLSQTQIHQTQDEIQFSTSITKIYQCYHCLNQIDHQVIQLDCFHNYHNQCLQEYISIGIMNGKSYLVCICNSKINQKMILQLIDKNNELKEQLFNNQLKQLIYIFQKKYQYRQITYDPNPIIKVNDKNKIKL